MKKNIVYTAIMGLAGLEILFISTHAATLERAPWWFFILAGFAAFRTARTISFNAVGEPIRARWTKVVPDGSGAGDNVEPKDGHPIGELLCCPICTGTHAALVILAAYSLAPGLGLALAGGLGIAGVSEVIHWMSEAAEWRAHTAREECGRLVRARESADKTAAQLWNMWQTTPTTTPPDDPDRWMKVAREYFPKPSPETIARVAREGVENAG